MSEPDQFLTPEVILLILLLLITLGMWIQLVVLRTRLSSRLARLEAKGGREIGDASEHVVEAMNDSRTSLDALRRDVVRLADDVRGEVGMSRAIEMARGGASKQAVADATGLSVEEAEAIVTFHGRAKS